MASWRDELRRASWRGIECNYADPDIERGRRQVVHEYPGRDEADIEDQGRKTRRYRVELYLLASQLGAAEFWARRDRLVEALEAEGPGTLVHPFYGALELSVEDVNESYRTAEGGKVSFQCTFVSAGKPRQPSRSIVTADVLEDRATDLQTSAHQVFLDQWRTVSLPEFVRDAARRVVGEAVDWLGLPGEIVDTINNAIGIIDGIQAARFRLSTYGLPRIRSLRDFGGNLPSPPRTTPSTRQQADNQQAVIDAVRTTTVAAAADTVAATTFDSVEAALAARDELLEAIDDLAQFAPDAVFESLRGLRTAVVEDIRSRGAGLPHVRTITPAQTEPASVLAYRIYGDATRADDIVRRNAIAHPGFVPGGEPLEVLTDV